MTRGMDTREPAFAYEFTGPRGGRLHRFMESADINAAFRELFAALRTNIRRGLSSDGQVYAVEMDGCIPGQLLATAWIPPSPDGVCEPVELADPKRRRQTFEQLLAESRPEALFAYVCEQPGESKGSSQLYLEIVSVDGTYAAEFPIKQGQGWARRELVQAGHRRLTSTAQQ